MDKDNTELTNRILPNLLILRNMASSLNMSLIAVTGDFVVPSNLEATKVIQVLGIDVVTSNVSKELYKSLSNDANQPTADTTELTNEANSL